MVEYNVTLLYKAHKLERSPEKTCPVLINYGSNIDSQVVDVQVFNVLLF